MKLWIVTQHHNGSYENFSNFIHNYYEISEDIVMLFHLHLVGVLLFIRWLVTHMI